MQEDTAVIAELMPRAGSAEDAHPTLVPPETAAPLALPGWSPACQHSYGAGRPALGQAGIWLKPARGIRGEITLKQCKLGWNSKTDYFLLGSSAWNSVQGHENWLYIFIRLKTERAVRLLLLKRPGVKWELLSKCLQRTPTKRSHYEKQQKIFCGLHPSQRK